MPFTGTCPGQSSASDSSFASCSLMMLLYNQHPSLPQPAFCSTLEDPFPGHVIGSVLALRMQGIKHTREVCLL